MGAAPINYILEGGYYGAEVEAVAKHYFDLPDSERDKFVEQRRAYVTMMEEVFIKLLLTLKRLLKLAS